MKLYNRKLFKLIVVFAVIGCVFLFFGGSFLFDGYIFLFFGDRFLFEGIPEISKELQLANLNGCPVCYGNTVCPLLYNGQIVLEESERRHFLNNKTVYRAKTNGITTVLLKQLAPREELRKLYANLCTTFKLENNCKPSQVKTHQFLEKIEEKVAPKIKRLRTEPLNGLLMCPYSKSIFKLLKPYLSPGYEYNLISIWTMLTVSAEPILFQLMPRHEGWPVPSYAGVCGSLELVAYAGEPISTLTHINWHRKLKLAYGIINAAMDFTYKHDKFRFYLMDWSTDNIVADKDDKITFVDLEDFIVLDKTISPQNSELHFWHERYSVVKIPGTSIDNINICQYHLSDHNIWEACNILAGGDKPFLYPIPDYMKRRKSNLHQLFQSCLNDGNNRYRTLIRLQRLISDILSK